MHVVEHGLGHLAQVLEQIGGFEFRLVFVEVFAEVDLGVSELEDMFGIV